MQHKWNKTITNEIAKDVKTKCIYCGKYYWSFTRHLGGRDFKRDREFCIRRTLALSSIMHIIDCCTDTFVNTIDCIIYGPAESLPGTSPTDAVSH